MFSRFWLEVCENEWMNNAVFDRVRRVDSWRLSPQDTVEVWERICFRATSLLAVLPALGDEGGSR